MLCPGEPQIWNINNNEYDDYLCFSFGDLFSDLLLSNAGKNPLVCIDNLPQNAMDRLLFFFPDDLKIKIKNYKKNGKSYLIDKDNNSDYKWPFRPTGDNLKFFVVIHNLFFENGGKTFISTLQKHLINTFSQSVITDYIGIKEYLETVGNYIIVPSTVSHQANNKLTELVSKGDKQSIVLVISNFLISAFLGIVPLNYLDNAKDSGKTYKKAYLLNKLGMEYIWTPELITTRYEKLLSIQHLFADGHNELSYREASSWLKKYKDESSPKECAEIYRILGLSLYKLDVQDGKDEYKNKEKDIKNYLNKCISTKEADPYVYYFLYRYNIEKAPKKAFDYLKTAFTYDYPKAVAEVAKLYTKQNVRNEWSTVEDIVSKLNKIIDNERDYSEFEIAECLYWRGVLRRTGNNKTSADRDFKRAAEMGNEKAKQEVSRKERTEKLKRPLFISNPELSQHSNCCFVNKLSGNNLAALSTFPSSEWSVYTTDENNKNNDIYTIHELDEFICSCHIGELDFDKSKRIVFFYMSEDEKKNLNECLVLLDKLFNVALDLSKDKKEDLIDAIDIFVSARYETASMLIDANLSDMGRDIYFKVHIADMNRDTAHKLLCDAPLFIPALSRTRSEQETNVVLIGGSETNYTFIKESIACSYMGEKHPVHISLIGENADYLCNRFHQECPGIYNSADINCIRPEFIQCNIRETDFPDCIYGKIYKHVSVKMEKTNISGVSLNSPKDKEIALNENEDNGTRSEKQYDSVSLAIAEVLVDANYFIVDFADDLENIRFATNLRTWLLRSGDTFDRAPFIAVKCSDEQNSYLASHLTLSGQASGNSYYNKYDLFPIGIASQIYSYDNIIDNPILDEVALMIHKYYYLDSKEEINEALNKCKRSAENDFYSYSYNVDSSLLAAIGLCYRVFSAGIKYDNKNQYFHYRCYKETELFDKFNNYIEDKLHVEEIANLEQSRFNGFVLTRGWESANIKQVRNYDEYSSGSTHKQILAKMHPFIRSFENINDKTVKEVLKIFKEKYDYEKSPQESTRRNIKDTKVFVTKAIEVIEKRKEQYILPAAKKNQ